jgi:hypothetical protein
VIAAGGPKPHQHPGMKYFVVQTEHGEDIHPNLPKRNGIEHAPKHNCRRLNMRSFESQKSLSRRRALA